MTEIQNILQTIERIISNGLHGAIATLVQVHGSSYRQPGARMVLVADGTWHGAISGGCLEGDVLLRAQTIMQQNVPSVVRYDTTNDEQNVFGVGLGCNGIIDILIEPFYSMNDTCVTTLQLLTKPECTTAHALVFTSSAASLPVGTHCVVTEINTPNNIPYKVLNDCRKQCAAGESANHEYELEDGSVCVFIEILQPQTQLVVFGAGYDAKPVVDIARTLGWYITVTDKSQLKANATTFQNADAVICAQPSAVLSRITFTGRTVCLLMSHNFMYDVDTLIQLLQTDVRYIGILGPRKRWEKMQAEIAKQGIEISSDILQKIYSPVGLDISAETPEEIALSMIAEIQHVLHGGTALPLRNKSGTIHSRSSNELI